MICKKLTGEVMISKLKLMDSFMGRLRGYMFYRRAPCEAILLTPAQSIHTFFMNFPIHVVCLSHKNIVTKVHKHVPPRRLIFWDFKYSKVIEIPCALGDDCNFKIGDALVFEDACID